MKLSDGPPPKFSLPEGRFSVDYRDHNGRFFIGTGEWLFETSWSAGGQGVIHVMNDPSSIKGVAVAPDAIAIEDVTESHLSRANFTSRHRTPTKGQVVLFENSNGYFAAVEIHEVTHTPEGTPGTAIDGRYRILTDRSRNFAQFSTAPYAELRASISDALSTLRELEPEPSLEYKSIEFGIGHNNPPMEHALTEAEHRDTVSVLVQLDTDASAQNLTHAAANSVTERLSVTIDKITSWASSRLKLIEEGFFRQLGALAVTGMTGLGIWALAAGKLEAVVTVLQNLFP